jgi:uncharacterized protein
MRPEEYRALPLDGNLQTIWAASIRRGPHVPFKRETWTTPDGVVIDVERLPRRKGPGIVVLHGLEGSSAKPYMRGMLRKIHERQWNGVCVNFRSCGPSAHRFPRTYHSGFTSDLAFVVDRLRTEGIAPLGAVGFSLGGNVVVKYMAEQGDAGPVVAAVGISVPFDLGACVAAIDGVGFWPAVYRSHFLRQLKRKALSSAQRFPGSVDEAHVRGVRTLRDFDEHVTARLFGFASATDYWMQSSSGRLIDRIRRPTLLLSAADDPMVPVTAIPRDAIASNSAIDLALLPHGGHVGFVGGSFRSPYYAAERLAAAFLSLHFQPSGLEVTAPHGCLARNK